MKIKMVNGLSFVLFPLIVMMSCAASKEGRTMKRTINGTWTLQAVNTEKIPGRYKATVFNEADINCFIGSTWNFVSNNSMGNYTLSSANGCTPATRNIRWSVYEPAGEEKKLQFKRLDEKKNPLDNNDGFRLSIITLTDATMQLKSAVVFEGKPAAIIYSFVKN